MTTDQETAPQQVAAEPGSRLEALHASYADAKAAADEAAARLKAVTDGIKVELTQRNPEARRFALTGAAGPALALTYTETWRFDSKRLKVDDPETYVRYAKKSGSWSLRVAQDGGPE